MRRKKVEMKQRNQRYPSQAPMLRILGNIALGFSILCSIVMLLVSLKTYEYVLKNNPEIIIPILLVSAAIIFGGFVCRVLFFTLAEYCEGFNEANFYLRKMNRGE